MIDVNLINDFVVTLGSFLSALTVVGGFIYQVIWKPYAKRKEEKEEKHRKKQEEKEEEYREKMLEITEKQTKPIVELVQKMSEEFRDHNQNADERDRLIAQNAEIIKKHEEMFVAQDGRLDNHNDRLIVLEVKNGVRKVTYREGSEE